MKIFYSGYQPLFTAAKPLPNVACIYVLLTASSVLLDDSRILPDGNGSFKTNGDEVLWGVQGKCIHQLFVTETSMLIPVANLNEITVRCANPATGQFVSYSCFK